MRIYKYIYGGGEIYGEVNIIKIYENINININIWEYKYKYI